MNLFELVGTIAIDNAKAINALDETGDKAKDAAKDIAKTGDESEKSEGKLSKAFTKIGEAAVKMGKAVVIGVGTMATAIGAFVGKAIGEYADYEQLVGGVETLFKDSSSNVLEYANMAYKTAGMSANEYMETVTGFSASLLQSLDGDTAKASEKANQAIIDMSDNANKMGSNMESIQNAYQGFAKQNYTMLDNLKLGYGGTKEEMERLLEDAEKISGIKYDISSYSDIVDAIHVVQDEMGITGTTAKEASETISGSAGQMKSAWKNFLTGMADSNQDFDKLVNNLVDSIMAFGDNLIPRIIETVPRIVQGLSTLIQKIVPYIPPLISKLLPALIQGATTLLSEVVNNLPSILDSLFPGIGGQIGNTITKVLSSIASMIERFLPPLIELALQILPVILDLIDMLLPPLMQIVEAIFPILIDIIGLLLPLLEPIISLLQPILDLLILVLDPLTQLLNMILPPLIEVLTYICEGLIEGVIKPILEWLSDFLGAVLVGAIDILVGVIKNCGESFSAVWNTIKNVWTPAKNFFSGIWSGIKSIFSGVREFFRKGFADAYNTIEKIFKPITNFFSGIWSRIKNIFSKVGEVVGKAIKSVVEKAVNGVLGSAVKIINGFISAINGAIGIINKIPGVKISKLSKLDVPELEEGGVLKKGQVGYLEGNGAEAVVPLDKNKKWIRALREDMESEFNINNDSDRVVSKLDELISAISSLKICLNNDVLVGQLAPAMDTALGTIYGAKGRGR